MEKMLKITNKLVESGFWIRVLSDKIYSGEAKESDIKETRKKINDLLKEVSKLIKE